MQEHHILRIKSAMIIYALENALGSFVLNSDAISNHTTTDQEDDTSRQSSIPESDIKLLVESSYLDDIFTYAMKASEGSSLEPKMKALKKFCSLLNIFDIRNAISHPNRPFPDVYWFRSAAIASDPLILQLGLNEVRQSLNSANDGKLASPPEDWINNVAWAIPNTLPTSFDHEITGLLGRDKEFKDLESTLGKVRNNLIALVAPGGVGKTALILQFLRDISLNPKWCQKINSILFCSLKNEKLTAEGVERIKAIDGIDQVKESILVDLREIYNIDDGCTFEDVCDRLENEKILICIDNLETLLIRSQEEFKDFNQSLPLQWRIIVTSRISLDSATTVPLQPLVKRHAFQLCRSYLRKRGVSDIEQTDIERISEKANYNPLAIRLTVDLYVKGVDIVQSISKTEKEIAAFSYSNLIESMTETSIEILEALYVSGTSSRNHLVEVLEHPQDDISESLNELSKTSLIIRTSSESGNDKFDLSNSIRDLLLTNPRNIEVRNKIASNLKARNLKIQEQEIRNQKLGITEFDDDHVLDSTDSSIKAAIIDLNKFLNQRKKDPNVISRLKNRFSDLVVHHNSNKELIYHFSRIYGYLKDSTSELELIERSITLDNENPKFIKARGLNLFNSGKYKEANNDFQILIDRKFDLPDHSSKKFSYSLIKLYLLSFLFQGKYQEILDYTENWFSHPWGIMLGTYRASAYRRLVEGQNNQDGSRESAYSLILEIFEQIFNSQNYPAIACKEGVKILRDLSGVITYIDQYSIQFIHQYLVFVSNHFFEMVSAVSEEGIDSIENQDFLKLIYDCEVEGIDNPLLKVSWYNPNVDIEFDEEHIDEMLSEGFNIVEVYKIPQGHYGMSSYMFAKDKKNNEFYLNVDSFQNGWNSWGYVELGDKLAIKYDNLSSKEATKAKEIIPIDKYRK
ncbi:hypothetical protein ACH3O9_07140 [Leeuwenhoekiella sp. A16]|uniref:hypothetical protein n=1 Tax=Leeuwenhoekiella sp. A16 TaxID=3141462 RepID=UPI003A7FE1CE